MDPLRIRVARIIDSGTIVSLVGTDVDAGTSVTIHVDHRPFPDFWRAWYDSGFPQPIEYDADHPTLILSVAPDGQVGLNVTDDSIRYWGARWTTQRALGQWRSGNGGPTTTGARG
jgi:hypothetical protein